MKIKRCLKSEVPVPPNGYGYFYLDQETNKLKSWHIRQQGT